jgi:hypothetical protein
MSWHDLVCKEFRLFEYKQEQPHLYRQHDLMAAVQEWRWILQRHSDGPNATIGIVHDMDFDYFAIVYAAMSLGLHFVVLDASSAPPQNFVPLDLVIHSNDIDQVRLACLHSNARQVVNVDQCSNADIDPLPDQYDIDYSRFTMLSSVTSGTTDKPNLVSHSYQYFLDIAKRNASILNLQGRCAHVRNLHHGSSLPVWFLPTVMSCNFHVCIRDTEPHSKQFVEDLRWLEYLDVNHFMLPAAGWLEAVLETVHQHDMKFTDLTLYTLGYIDPALSQYVQGTNIKIVSIFGCTETSGPIMLNTLTAHNINTFDPKIFQAPDDFYNIVASDQGTMVTARDHSVQHLLQDRFETVDHNTYRHLGRSTRYQLGGHDIDLAWLDHIVSDLSINGQIVVDSVNQCLYLAVWNQDSAALAQQQVNNKLATQLHSNSVQVRQSQNLVKQNFVTGIKLNQELIRVHFRNLEQ